MYGVPYSTYKELLVRQNNLCAICHKPEKSVRLGKVRPLFLDHCHETKRIRGLLCHRCNIAIGQLDDNVSYLKNAIKYLQGDI